MPQKDAVLLPLPDAASVAYAQITGLREGDTNFRQHFRSQRSAPVKVIH